MSATTKIEWADATWNPMTGCTKISEACEHCYARGLLRRFAGKWGLLDDGRDSFCPRFIGDRMVPGKTYTVLDKPLHWRKPRRIFVCSMSDLFHEAFTDTERDAVFAVMALCPQHTFLVLTKRPERMRDYVSKPIGQTSRRDWVLYQAGQMLNQVHIDGFPDWPLPNLWLGVTAENQQRADERIPILLDTPAAVRFVSVEPCWGRWT